MDAFSSGSSKIYSDQFNNYFVENGLIMNIGLDAEGLIEECSVAFSHLLGMQEDELVGRYLIDFVADSTEFRRLLPFRQNTFNLISFPLTFLNNEKKFIYTHMKGVCFNFKNINKERFIFVVNDISELVRSYEIIRKQEQSLKIQEDLLLNKDQTIQSLKVDFRRLNDEIGLKKQEMTDLYSKIVENEMRLKLSFNAVNDGIWDLDIIANTIYFSDKFFTMLGYDAFEFSHTLNSWKVLIHPDDLVIVNSLLESTISGQLNEFSLEYRMHRKDNSYCWVLSRGSLVERDQAGHPLRMMGTHVDIDKLKKIEIELKESEIELRKKNEEYVVVNKKLKDSNKKTTQLFQQLHDKQAYLNSILKTVPASIGLIADRIILFANNYSSLMTGYEVDELLGHNVAMLYDSDEEYKKVQCLLYENTVPGTIKSATTVWKMKNGTLIDVYITATRIDSDIAENAYTISAIDISAQRLYEEELIKAKEQAERAERLKTVFLCNMSHELRTPMNGIIGFAEMLRETVNHSKKDEYLKIIINSSKQLMRIINDIIDISKIETGEVETFFTPLNLPQIMAEIHETYLGILSQRGKSNIDLFIDACDSEVSEMIITDEIKLRHILSCLLNNSVKFTDSGQISFSYRLKEGYLEFCVTDTGIGIEDDEKEVVFECFRQSESPVRKKYGGNGIGLAIARGFTQILGGKIWLESQIGVGSTFYFTLPYRPYSEPNIEVVKSPAGRWANLHILVVEDDLTCKALIDELLEETGIFISHAATGLEAVKACRKDMSINIVLMDMRLPEIDGYEATQRIKEFRPELTIIAQTAHALSEDRKKCIAAGCNDYITKPLDQDKLLTLLDSYLSKL